MKLDDSHPVLIASQSAVLLIFFMPAEPVNRQQRAMLSTLASSIQKQFGSLVRVIQVDEATHPDVVQSFAITQTPAFVLVRRGIELWRQVGMSDETTLIELLQGLLTADRTKNQL